MHRRFFNYLKRSYHEEILGRPLKNPADISIDKGAVSHESETLLKLGSSFSERALSPTSQYLLSHHCEIVGKLSTDIELPSLKNISDKMLRVCH